MEVEKCKLCCKCLNINTLIFKQNICIPLLTSTFCVKRNWAWYSSISMYVQNLQLVHWNFVWKNWHLLVQDIKPYTYLCKYYRCCVNTINNSMVKFRLIAWMCHFPSVYLYKDFYTSVLCYKFLPHLSPLTFRCVCICHILLSLDVWWNWFETAFFLDFQGTNCSYPYGMKEMQESDCWFEICTVWYYVVKMVIMLNYIMFYGPDLIRVLKLYKYENLFFSSVW